MDKYEYKKYVTNKDNIMNTLDDYGVAIIPKILDDEICEDTMNKTWNFFEFITNAWEIPIKKNDKKTWRGFYNLYPMHSMLYQHWHIGHNQFIWDIRQNPKILDIFSQIWKCENDELLVSFDTMSFGIPPEETNRGWNRNNTWYHSDQSFTRNDLECIQSWVTLEDVDNGDATLSFFEKSHKYHKEFKESFNITDKKDWYKLNVDELQFFKNKNCSEKKIKCPKGSLVLWDSRTIHCGTEPFKDRKMEKFRNVIYLCYKPRVYANEKQLKKKRKAFEELRMTTHWPCKSTLFPKTPRTYGNPIFEIKKIDPPILNEIGKKLAGF